MSPEKLKSPPTELAPAFARRLYLAHLIDSGINSVPALMEATGMPRRTVQDSIRRMNELSISCVYVGARRNGMHQIKDWGAIDKHWVEKNLKHVTSVL